jgi:hypothetical protein
VSIGTREVGGVVLLQPPPPSGVTSSSSKETAELTSSADDLPCSDPAGVSNPGTPPGVQAFGAVEADFSQLALENRSSSECPGAAAAGGDDWGDFVG